MISEKLKRAKRKVREKVKRFRKKIENGEKIIDLASEWECPYCNEFRKFPFYGDESCVDCPLLKKIDRDESICKKSTRLEDEALGLEEENIVEAKRKYLEFLDFVAEENRRARDVESEMSKNSINKVLSTKNCKGK